MVAFINGDDGLGRAVALESASEDLSDPTSPESMEALAAHLPVLQALFYRLSLESLSCRQTVPKVALMKAALQAQNSYARTLALLSGLKLQQRGDGGLTMEAESWR
jgi:hypothetical protein